MTQCGLHNVNAVTGETAGQNWQSEPDFQGSALGARLILQVSNRLRTTVNRNFVSNPGTLDIKVDPRQIILIDHRLIGLSQVIHVRDGSRQWSSGGTTK